MTDIAIGRGDNAPRRGFVLPFDPTGSTFTLTLFPPGVAPVVLTTSGGALVVDGPSKTVTWVPSSAVTAALPLGALTPYTFRRDDSGVGGEVRFYQAGAVIVTDGPTDDSTVTTSAAGPQGASGQYTEAQIAFFLRLTSGHIDLATRVRKLETGIP